jgi:hypothetical protein
MRWCTHGGVFLPPNKLFVNSNNSLNDFRRVNTNKGTVDSLTYVEDPNTWKKTLVGIIKVIGMQLLIRPRNVLGSVL